MSSLHRFAERRPPDHGGAVTDLRSYIVNVKPLLDNAPSDPADAVYRDASEDEDDVVTFDVAGTFLLPTLPKGQKNKVSLKLKGVFVDIMYEVNPSYKNTIIHERGGKVLYMLVLRSIHGIIQAALLWYELYSNKLQEMGFVLNPCDSCVANKIINGKQCTIAWHVDDN